MSNRTCVKCGGDNLYVTNVDEHDGGLPKSGKFMGLKAVVSAPVVIRRTLCVGCGHLEMYVADANFLRSIPNLDAWTKI